VFPEQEICYFVEIIFSVKETMSGKHFLNSSPATFLVQKKTWSIQSVSFMLLNMKCAVCNWLSLPNIDVICHETLSSQ